MRGASSLLSLMLLMLLEGVERVYLEVDGGTPKWGGGGRCRQGEAQQQDGSSGMEQQQKGGAAYSHKGTRPCVVARSDAPVCASHYMG